MSTQDITEAGKQARFRRWEELGLDRVKSDLLNGGHRLIGGSLAVRELAWEWVRMKEQQGLPAKRDMDVIRELLLEIEAGRTDFETFPLDPMERARLVNPEARKFRDDQLHLMQQAGLSGGTAKKVTDFTTLVLTFSDLSLSMDAYEMAQKIASGTGIMSELYLDKSPENISRYENTQELLNAIQQFTLNAIEEGRPALLPNFLEEVSLLTDQDNEKIEDFDKVTLMTVHSSKGLEFNNVFVVGLEENLFPSGFSGTMTLAELEEERRLFYVALTRSKHQAFLSFAQQRFKWGKTEFCHPSRFIGEIDSQYLDIENSRFFHHQLNNDLSDAQKGFDRDSFSSNKRSSFAPPKTTSSLGANYRRGAEPASAEPFESDDPNSLQIGMFVEHQRFGRGKIIDLEGAMPEKKAKVFFVNAGEKQLLLKFAKLKIVD